MTQWHTKLLAAYSILITLMVVLLLFHLHSTSLGTARKTNPSISVGATVSDFGAQRVWGPYYDVQFGEGQKIRLVCVLRTTCPFCERTLPIWASIAKRNPDIEILALVTDGPERAKQHPVIRSLPFPVLVASKDLLNRFKVSSVPQTIVLDPSGEVLMARRGRLDESDLSDIEELLTAARKENRIASNQSERRR